MGVRFNTRVEPDQNIGRLHTVTNQPLDPVHFVKGINNNAADSHL